MSSRKGKKSGESSSVRRRKGNDGIRKEIKPIRMTDLESGLPNRRRGPTVGQISACMLAAAVICWAISFSFLVETEKKDNMTLHVILVLVTTAIPFILWAMQFLSEQVIPDLQGTEDAHWIYFINLIQSVLSAFTLTGSLKIHLDDDNSQWMFAIGLMVGLMLYQIGRRNCDDFGGVGLILGSLFVRLHKNMDIGYLFIIGLSIDFVKRTLVTLLARLNQPEELQEVNQLQLLREEQEREREQLEKMKKEVEQARQELEMKKQALTSDLVEIENCWKLTNKNLNRKQVHVPEFIRMKQYIDKIKE